MKDCCDAHRTEGEEPLGLWASLKVITWSEWGELLVGFLSLMAFGWLAIAIFSVFIIAPLAYGLGFEGVASGAFKCAAIGITVFVVIGCSLAVGTAIRSDGGLDP